MQTFDRARLIARAHVRSLLEKAEDRRKTRQLMLEDMREDIRNVKSLVTNAIADQKLIERQIAESESEAKKWEEHAVFALKKGEDELSRRALSRKHQHIERANRFREQLETQQETIESLKESLKTLATKLDAARYQAAKLDVYEQREELRTQRETIVATPTSPEIDTGAFDAYDRLVERVQDLEAQAEAFAELARDDDLERKFRELQSRDQVERDLEALKAKVAAEQENAS